MINLLYIYVRESLRVYFIMCHELSHYVIATLLSFFIKDLIVSDFKIVFAKISKHNNGYNIQQTTGYITINTNRNPNKDFFIFLIKIAPLLFTPLWLYLAYNIHLYVFIIFLGFLPSLLPSVDDLNSIYNYIGYKLLLWH